MKLLSSFMSVWWRRQSNYDVIATDEIDSEYELKTSQNRFHRDWYPIWLTVINLTFASITLTAAFCMSRSPCVPTVDARYENAGTNEDLKRVSAYSPVLDQVELSPKMKTLNGLFHDNETIFMQDPSPEVDKAWELYSQDIFLTSEETIRRSGRNPSEYIQGPLSKETGMSTYIVQWDVFHQIHCLNWLRKAVNWDYYYGDQKPGEVWLDHQKHCLHMLLQVLTCHADLDPIPYQWMEKRPHMIDEVQTESEDALDKEVSPQPDFMVHKMCRNFDALVEWAEANRAPDPAALRKELHYSKGVKVWSWNDL